MRHPAVLTVEVLRAFGEAVEVVKVFHLGRGCEGHEAK